LKAKINNALSSEGINLRREALSSNKALERVLALPLSPLLSAEIRVLVHQVRSLNQSIAELEELIEEEGPKLAGHENLMSIKGIGPISAAVLLSAIGWIEDFRDRIHQSRHWRKYRNLLGYQRRSIAALELSGSRADRSIPHRGARWQSAISKRSRVFPLEGAEGCI